MNAVKQVLPEGDARLAAGFLPVPPRRSLVGLSATGTF
jgi:hypothetical protein